MARFIVAKGELEKAIEYIIKFTSTVNELEDGCLLYRSLQSNENELEFVHYMIFDTKESEDRHRTTEYVKEFVDKLYPILEKKTEFTSYNVIAG